jgi:heptosyltransferase-3
MSFGSAALRIRRERPTQTLELVSDIRERWACRLLGAPRNLSPAWEIGHPFRKHSRMGRFKPSDVATIPVAVTGLYAALNLVLVALVGSARANLLRAPAWPAWADVAPDTRMRIGIHPFASAPCKLWPRERWVALIASLRGRFPRAAIVLFGAPPERDSLDEMSRLATGETQIVTASLREFKATLQHVDLLIGLDSFSVHLAHSLGVPAIVLVGPNDPALFTPPGARTVTHPGECVYQPCGGRPKCKGTSFEYACMRAISAPQVMNEIVDASKLSQ